MPECAIELTNKRSIRMSIPNGSGKNVTLNPGETRVVWGDYEYFRRMPAQGMNGLVVKKDKSGKVRLVEEAKQMDVKLARVTNHRKIPMLLDTGVDRRRIEIAPKATTNPILVRMSLVKQMTGITVRVVKEEKKLPAVAFPAQATTSPPVKEIPVSKTESAEAPSPGKAATDAKLGDMKKNMGLPATREEWLEKSRRFVGQDLRGMAHELGIKAQRRNDIINAITEVVYGSEDSGKE